MKVKPLIWKTAVNDPTYPDGGTHVAIFVDRITHLEESWLPPTQDTLTLNAEAEYEKITVIHLTNGRTLQAIYTLKECLEQLNELFNKRNYE